MTEVWLTAVIALSGVVLIALVMVLFRGTQAVRRRDPSRPRPAASRGTGDSPSPSTVAARGLHHVFAAARPPRARSVEGNLHRAFLRIDSVDPFAAPRRIGLALSDEGLLDPGPSSGSEGKTVDTWPLSGTRRARHPSEDEQ